MTSGSTAILVDTNVVIYAIDPTDPFKHQRAIDTLEWLDHYARGTLSVQCLNEFFAAATRRIPLPLSSPDARWLAGVFATGWPVVALTSDVSLTAMDAVLRHQLSFWDAVIWAAANLNGIQTILSEDFNSGAVLGGVRFINPFDPAFTFASLR